MTEKTDHDMIVEMHTILVGLNGNGLIKRVQENAKAIVRLKVALAFMAASIGGGVFSIIRFVV